MQVLFDRKGRGVFAGHKDLLAFQAESINNRAMIQKIFIWPNLTKDKYIHPVREAVETLEKRGFTCLLAPEAEARLFPGSSRHTASIAEADMVLSVGGDGTFLRAAEAAIAFSRPLCGYNAGRLGYLCALEGGSLAAFAPEALRFYEEPVLRCRLEGKEYFALSDIVIGKDYFGGTIVPAWQVGTGKEKSCIGDGLILSTPLGSTGYTRSAGGPFLRRGCGQFSATPICPHTGEKEACAFPDTEQVRVLNTDPTYSASVYADGRYIGPLGTALIQKAPFTLSVARKSED